MGTIKGSPLGKSASYPVAYDPGLLYPVERGPQRRVIGIGDALPFHGADRWTAWEATWLDPAGRPKVAIAAFDVPCTSPRLVESKSVKLYFAALNHERFGTAEAFRGRVARDLTAATQSEVNVRLALPAQWALQYARSDPLGTVIDDAAPADLPSFPDASVLRSIGGDAEETLISHAFRSVCPVTGQPDYASLTIAYQGPRIDRASLLAYLVGFRSHPGFHEHCVERIHVDLARAFDLRKLTVEARFTRRGGIDINPLRASASNPPPGAGPTLRQ